MPAQLEMRATVDPAPEPPVPPVITDPPEEPEPEPIIPEPDPTHTPVVPPPEPEPATDGAPGGVSPSVANFGLP
jgi:hypothetical protein